MQDLCDLDPAHSWVSPMLPMVSLGMLSNSLLPNDVARVGPGQCDAVRSIFQCDRFCGDLHFQAFLLEVKPDFAKVRVEFLILCSLGPNDLPIDHHSCEEQGR